jgi:spore coat protein CotH
MRVTIASVCTIAVAAPLAVAAVPTGTALAAPPIVVINEIHYHPADDDPAAEFIELHNTTSNTVGLSGWCVDGIDYCFPAGSSVGPNGFVVRTGDLFGGRLSNGGEDITLSDATGTVVDFVEYDDKEEWPGMADGEGPSLQRRDPRAESDTGANWESGPPTPGAPNVNRGVGLLPAFDDVEHTHFPRPGAPIVVTAKITGATNIKLGYRIGFGPEVLREVDLDDGVVTGQIPGQPAGTLVRYRLIAENSGRWGTWPRQGDGSTYWGTTVARAVATELPLFEIFMPDADYQTMYNDLTLRGDDGYPMVFAYRGAIVDNTRIRVKGQSSRTFSKKKFKIILPPGYDLEDDDLLEDDVDEWAMHSGWIDKSFLRETLSSEFMTDADVRGTQQAFPVRFERNGQLLGLYTYVEQPDGTYRDRYGLDDSEVYEVGPDNLYGLLSPNDPGRSQEALRARYDKETFEYLNDARLREFIAVVNQLRGVSERNWIYDNVDVPSVVNVMAASMVIQNQDWGVKNYRLVFDPYGRVGIVQNDYDFTWGRRWSMPRGPFDSRVYVGGTFEQPGGPFFETFFYDPELAEMLKRRIRTLTEELLEPGAVAARVNELAATIRPEAVADRAIWGTYGSAADPTAEADRIMSSFVRPQYERLLGRYAAIGKVARTSQPAIPNVVIEDVRYDGVEHVTVRNVSGDSVDISSFEIPELDFTVPGGTVLLPGRGAIFVHEDAETTKNQYRGFLFAGYFEESLTEATDGITLRNRTGAVVASRTQLPPGQIRELAGEAGRSAIVSIVATQTTGPGYLQLLDCADDPGATSNLNVDGSGQTRSTLGLARFDADGTACLYNLTATHELADVQGYFADGVVDDIDDRRLLDTRRGSKPTAGAVTRITGGRPDSTGIVSLVATATTGPGYLAIVPCGSITPDTSNLNWVRASTTVAGLSFVRFDAAGEACVYNLTSTHVLADVQGYLDATGFDDVDDERILDTRSGSRPADRSTTVLRGRAGSTAVVSLVATAATGPGYLQVLPCDGTAGATSNVNYDAPGATVAGLTTVRFGPDGTACVYALTSTHIVADVQGYFEPGAFDDIDDERLIDTRND